MSLERGELEQRVRRLCDAGDHDAAAVEGIRGYGPEIFGLLSALHRDEDEAADVFSAWSESLWRGLPRFAWQCTLRTWAYVIARHASLRARKVDHRRRANMAPGDDSAVARVAQAVRTETASFLRTGKRDRLAVLRDSLPSEDRLLLVLRVDRDLAWDDIARVVRGLDSGSDAPGDVPLDAAELKRESARLRKRFQLVRDKLVALGKKEGLIRS